MATCRLLVVLRSMTSVGVMVTGAGPVAAGLSDLRITEVWPGGLPGDENTHDWIELTNLGDTTIAGIDGLHYRDSPVPASVPDGLFLNGAGLTGVSELLPGESAVFLISWVDPLGPITNPTLADAIDAFRAMWGLDLGDIKLGYMLDGDSPETGGPGLSSGGDTVIIYDGDVTGSAVVDSVSFPASDRASYIFNPWTELFGDFAQSGSLGAREGLLPASDEIAGDLPPIASPGVVPEPAGLALLATALSFFGLRRQGVHRS